MSIESNMEKLRAAKDQPGLFQQANFLIPLALPTAAPPPSRQDDPEQPVDAGTSPKEESADRSGAVVRETFSMPPSDSDLIDALRARAGRHGRLCFRSEIVRAALRSLAALDEVRMIAAVDAVERVEQGKKKMKKKG